MKMNGVIIRDINLSLNLNEFAKDFAKMSVSLLMNYFSGYKNFPSHAESRDMIAIIILLDFLRQTTLLQEATNSIAQCQRALITILKKNLSHDARVYINNVMIRGSKIKYNNKKVFSGIK